MLAVSRLVPEAYRLSHQPRPGYAPVFICPFVVLTDLAGQLYNAMRGVQGQNKNETVSMARSDAEVTTCFTDRGSLSRVELALGDDASFTLEQAGSTDWPLHTCGTVGSSSAACPQTIARSWNYTGAAC
jgi:hypothetical protein